MRGNSSQPPTPSGQFLSRLRFASFTSPNLSPLMMNPSPLMGESSFYQFSNQSELHNFQLEENGEGQNSQKEIEDEQEEDYDHLQPFPFQIKEEEEGIMLDESNILEFILRHCKRDQKKMEKARKDLEDYGSEVIKKMFDNLRGKFDKLKKTKEEMIKYCIRRSFKFITSKMRAQNKQAFIDMENTEVVAYYFQQNNEGDESISMPFQKTSEEKTMNSTFLKKIFKCRQYNLDYEAFLKQFPIELASDNSKKIKSMNDVIKKAVKTRSCKGLDDYKRLPWTYEILGKLNEFAKSLTEHSPYKKQQLLQKKLHQQFEDSGILLQENVEARVCSVPKKNNVIILTPPMKPLGDPMFIPDEQI